MDLETTGIFTKQGNIQINFMWADVEEILETPDSIDFFMRQGGIIVARKRAFASEEEFKRFFGVANQYLEQSRSSANITSNN